MNLSNPDLPDDLEQAILDLKRERRALLLAHYYQESEVQDLADVVGDSLALAQAAQGADCDVIAFCGVHFMAETAKLLNPDKPVVVPDLEAGCSLADGCPPDEFQAFIDEHPGAAVLTYINASAAVKAKSDLICTSSNAVKMVEHLTGRPIIFAPDRHLARFVGKQTGRDDLIVRFPPSGLAMGETEACLTGATWRGPALAGCVALEAPPPPPSRWKRKLRRWWRHR